MTIIERREPIAEVFDWPSDLHPVLRQVLARRPLRSSAELELKLSGLIPVGSFDALGAGIELLLRHRDNSIIIVGDFDADGATSTALGMLTLEALGFTDVSYFIPDRFALGYGLSPGVIEHLRDKNSGLIVTVDNGISSHDGVDAAREAGFDVLITDHHLAPPELPRANAIINPNLPDDDFPGKNLAGVGVIFYLLAALGRELGQTAKLANYLDLVALGTVADLVPMDHANRILVEQGLKRIRAGQCRPGIQALCEVAGVDRRTTTASTLGFQLGPRLNAAGRLDDMSVGVRCLLTESTHEAKQLAAELDGLNRERRALEARMKGEALAIVDELAFEDANGFPAAICLRHETWHEGLVGLVASRVKDRYHRPTFAFAPTGSGGLKGSGRSIAGLHLRDALADVASTQPGLIEKFGGHAMAAGLTMPSASFEPFEEALVSICTARLDAAALSRCVLTDGGLAADDMNLGIAMLLRDALPWGQGFPEPSFDGHFELVDCRVLKDAHLKMKLLPKDCEHSIEAIAFNQADRAWAVGEQRQLAYKLSVNDYFSSPRVQLVVEHISEEGRARNRSC